MVRGAREATRRVESVGGTGLVVAARTSHRSPPRRNAWEARRRRTRAWAPLARAPRARRGRRTPPFSQRCTWSSKGCFEGRTTRREATSGSGAVERAPVTRASNVLQRGPRTRAFNSRAGAFDPDSHLKILRRNRTESRPRYTRNYDSDDSESPNTNLSKNHSSQGKLSSSEHPPTRPSRRRGRPTARRVGGSLRLRSRRPFSHFFLGRRRVASRRADRAGDPAPRVTSGPPRHLTHARSRPFRANIDCYKYTPRARPVWVGSGTVIVEGHRHITPTHVVSPRPHSALLLPLLRRSAQPPSDLRLVAASTFPRASRDDRLERLARVLERLARP